MYIYIYIYTRQAAYGTDGTALEYYRSYDATWNNAQQHFNFTWDLQPHVL